MIKIRITIVFIEQQISHLLLLLNLFKLWSVFLVYKFVLIKFFQYFVVRSDFLSQLKPGLIEASRFSFAFTDLLVPN
jgi:hypothetical protein